MINLQLLFTNLPHVICYVAHIKALGPVVSDKKICEICIWNPFIGPVTYLCIWPESIDQLW